MRFDEETRSRESARKDEDQVVCRVVLVLLGVREDGSWRREGRDDGSAEPRCSSRVEKTRDVTALM